MSELKGTKGPYTTAHESMVLGGDDALIAECSASEVGLRECAANLEFIAEAFNVQHETGMSPRELATKVAELQKDAERYRKLRQEDAYVIVRGKSLFGDWLAARDRILCLVREKAELVEKLQFLKSKGLTVGMATEAGKEPYLAYVIEQGSELCDLATVNKLVYAEIELRQLTDQRDELLKALNGVIEEWIDRGYNEYGLAEARAAIAKCGEQK